jgi:hypothetical protein
MIVSIILRSVRVSATIASSIDVREPFNNSGQNVEMFID